MKKLIMSAAILMSVVAASQADADSIQRTMSAKITKFDFQNASSLSEKRIRQGSVTINVLEKSLTVTLTPSFYCPPSMMCAQVMPRAIQYRVTNYSVTKGNCGELIYTAENDQRPVDGIRTLIVVTDRSSDTCKYFAPVAQTEINLETEHGRGFGSLEKIERHQFEAESLK